MEPSVEEKVASILNDIRNKIDIYLQWCESPIERLLLLAFIENSITSLSFTISSEDTTHRPTLSDEYGLKLAPAGLYWIEINELIIQKDRKFLRRIIPQYFINDEFENVSYRIDFALFWPRTDGKGEIRIAIECDGHDFHEKTKEQAQRDKEKDRYLQRKGWIIARYTGSEIVKDPLAILMEVENLALSRDSELFYDSQKADA